MSHDDAPQDFLVESRARVRGWRHDEALQRDARALTVSSNAAKYSYNFWWLGRPIIQYPQDMVAVQELVWAVRPDLIVETGIAHGGSLVLSASLLALIEMCDAAEAGTVVDPRTPARRVLGVDIDIRAHNRAALDAHPLRNRITMLEGSSVASDVVAQIRATAADAETVMVFLDSNHTHDHVLAELEAYAPLVTRGSYCVVFDTVVDDLPDGFYPNRPWGPGNSPKSAVQAYLEQLATPGRTDAEGTPVTFEVDEAIHEKLLLTVSPHGYLRRT